jgi:hypothetical protein
VGIDRRVARTDGASGSDYQRANGDKIASLIPNADDPFNCGCPTAFSQL